MGNIASAVGKAFEAIDDAFSISASEKNILIGNGIRILVVMTFTIYTWMTSGKGLRGDASDLREYLNPLNLISTIGEGISTTFSDSPLLLPLIAEVILNGINLFLTFVPQNYHPFEILPKELRKYLNYYNYPVFGAGPAVGTDDTIVKKGMVGMFGLMLPFITIFMFLLVVANKMTSGLLATFVGFKFYSLVFVWGGLSIFYTWLLTWMK